MNIANPKPCRHRWQDVAAAYVRCLRCGRTENKARKDQTK